MPTVLRTMILATGLAVCGVAGVAQADLVTGTYTLGGATSGAGPWNMTSTDNTFSILRFIPNTALAFSSYTSLVYNYDVNLGGIAAGGPRVVAVLDYDHNGSADGSVTIHWGPAGSFADPTVGDGFNTGNLLAMTDMGRYDLSGAGGSAYTDRAAALALIGSADVLRFSLLLDSFGGNNRDIDINSLTAMGTSVVPLPAAVWAGGATMLAVAGAGIVRRRRQA